MTRSCSEILIKVMKRRQIELRSKKFWPEAAGNETIIAGEGGSSSMVMKTMMKKQEGNETIIASAGGQVRAAWRRISGGERGHLRTSDV